MTFENKGRYYTIEGRRYEWRWIDSLCGLYEIEEQESENAFKRDLSCPYHASASILLQGKRTTGGTLERWQ